jgi:hypothetical protein
MMLEGSVDIAYLGFGTIYQLTPNVFIYEQYKR